jgi:hypothetical protein
MFSRIHCVLCTQETSSELQEPHRDGLKGEPLSGGFPRLGKGLCAAFHITDCLQVDLSHSSLPSSLVYSFVCSA